MSVRSPRQSVVVTASIPLPPLRPTPLVYDPARPLDNKGVVVYWGANGLLEITSMSNVLASYQPSTTAMSRATKGAYAQDKDGAPFVADPVVASRYREYQLRRSSLDQFLTEHKDRVRGTFPIDLIDAAYLPGGQSHEDIEVFFALPGKNPPRSSREDGQLFVKNPQGVLLAVTTEQGYAVVRKNGLLTRGALILGDLLDMTKGPRTIADETLVERLFVLNPDGSKKPIGSNDFVVAETYEAANYVRKLYAACFFARRVERFGGEIGSITMVTDIGLDSGPTSPIPLN